MHAYEREKKLVTRYYSLHTCEHGSRPLMILVNFDQNNLASYSGSLLTIDICMQLQYTQFCHAGKQKLTTN